MLVLWCVLLLPYPLVLMAAGMSSEAGNPIIANLFVGSALSYPILLTVSFVPAKETKSGLATSPELHRGNYFDGSGLESKPS